MIPRRKVLQGLLGVTLAGLLAGFWGLWAEPVWRLRVKTWRLQPAGWPRGQKLRIVMLADLHAAEPQMGLGRIADIVSRANALQGDLIVLMGDYRASHRFQSGVVPIETVAPVLAGLAAPLGVWAVQGNHDWWDDRAAQLRRAGPTLTEAAMQAAGLPVLENRAVRIGQGGAAFWLAGLGSQMAFLRGYGGGGVDDLPATLAQVTDDAPVILLAHEPDIFATAPPVALQLSGHTHGGQIRLFGWAPVVPSAYGNRFAYGHINEGGRDMVVSGGLGCSVLPVRFGSPPEITVVELS